MTFNQKIEEVEKLTYLMDEQFSIGPFRFGLDPLIGLVPVLGDSVTVMLSLALIIIAIQEKLPLSTIIKMLTNVAADFFVGSIPVVGDIWDFFFKAFSRNLKILKREAALRAVR